MSRSARCGTPLSRVWNSIAQRLWPYCTISAPHSVTEVPPNAGTRSKTCNITELSNSQKKFLSHFSYLLYLSTKSHLKHDHLASSSWYRCLRTLFSLSAIFFLCSLLFTRDSVSPSCIPPFVLNKKGHGGEGKLMETVNTSIFFCSENTGDCGLEKSDWNQWRIWNQSLRFLELEKCTHTRAHFYWPLPASVA